MKSKVKWPFVVLLLVLGGYVVLVFGYVALLWLLMRPPVVHRLQTVGGAHACINNLRMIDGGKEQAAVAFKWGEGTKCDAEPFKSRVNSYIKGNSTPECPAGGIYTYGVIGKNPSCALGTGTVKRVHARAFCWDWSECCYHNLEKYSEAKEKEQTSFREDFRR